MDEPKPIGNIVKTVFEDIQRKHGEPGRNSTKDFRDVEKSQGGCCASATRQLTGKDMLAYLSDEIRRRGIGRGKRRKA